MRKYLPLIIAVITLISIILAGVFHILPSDTVNQVAGAIIIFLLGHISGTFLTLYIQPRNKKT